MLSNKNFIDSLKYCKALITLAESVSGWLRLQLPVPVHTILHPSTPQTCPKSTYDNKSNVLLLGSQYRKISSIYNLKVPGFSKSWAPGTTNKKHINRLFSRDINIPDTTKMSDVSIRYVKSNAEYTKMIEASFVVIDLWDAAANNAVLESIYCKIPTLISKLPGTIEYLGKDYPLFFSNFNELQQIFNNVTMLKIKSREAIQYLEKVETKSVTDFGKSILNIAYTLNKYNIID